MKTLYIVSLVLFCAFLVTGCASVKNNGTLSRSDEITRAVESNTVIPAHTYYYTGPEAQPDAIIGIHHSYTFPNEKNFWIKVDISEDVLHSWNVIIDNSHRFRNPYYGSRILAPDGKEVGFWYSQYRYTAIQFPEPNSVVVFTPDLSPKDMLQPAPFTPQI